VFYNLEKNNLAVVNHIPRINHIKYWHSLRYLASGVRWPFSRIRESKTKLLFLIFDIFFNHFSYIYILSKVFQMVCLFLFFSISKIGNISHVNGFMTWVHLEFIEKPLDFKLAFLLDLITILYKYFIFTEWKIWDINYFSHYRDNNKITELRTILQRESQNS
jgi:hypothetical protein